MIELSDKFGIYDGRLFQIIRTKPKKNALYAYFYYLIYKECDHLFRQWSLDYIQKSFL